MGVPVRPLRRTWSSRRKSSSSEDRGFIRGVIPLSFLRRFGGGGGGMSSRGSRFTLFVGGLVELVASLART